MHGSLATLPWVEPDSSARVAFNGWTAKGVRLRVAGLDGTGLETLGPAASVARIASEGDGRVSVAAGGTWWHEAVAPEAAVPLDGAGALDRPLAFTADGMRVVYVVGPEESGRTGTWVAALP